MKRTAVPAWAVFFCTAASVLLMAAPTSWPKPSGFVSDFAGILDAAHREEFEGLLSDTERTTSAEIRLVTIPSLEDLIVNDYANRLFAAWRIGKPKLDNGVLVLVAPNDRRIFIEVGYGLEGVLPDGLAGEIVRDQFLPRFRIDDYPGGIRNGLARVVSVVRAGHVLTPEERARLDGAGVVSPWVLIPFFALFVAGGSFAAGIGIGTRTIGPLLGGGVAGGMAIGIAMALFVSHALVLLPVAALTGWWGRRQGRTTAWRAFLRRDESAGASTTNHWIMPSRPTGYGSRGRSGRSPSSGSSGGGRSLGGGRSGGGGAGGSW